MHRLVALLAAAFTAGCSVFGIRSGYEQPRCDVLDRVGDDVEIRRYGARLVAEATVEASDEETARSAAFRILAAYIFGENRAEETVAMTTPVVIEAAGQTLAMTAPVETSTAGPGRWSMRFFLPSDLTAATAPTPTDARVRVTQVPGETLAVLRFSGGTRAAAVAERHAELLRRLAASPWRAHGTPVTFFYDPPWTLPFLRRNEAAVAVRRDPANP